MVNTVANIPPRCVLGRDETVGSVLGIGGRKVPSASNIESFVSCMTDGISTVQDTKIQGVERYVEDEFDRLYTGLINQEVEQSRFRHGLMHMMVNMSESIETLRQEHRQFLTQDCSVAFENDPIIPECVSGEYDESGTCVNVDSEI
jgi:hypothetical protein